MSDPNECVARYEYDGLPALDAAHAARRCRSLRDRGAVLRGAASRVARIEKTVTNQGTGLVHGSAGGGITGIQAGDRLATGKQTCGSSRGNMYGVPGLPS
jgi:hypothetical protein